MNKTFAAVESFTGGLFASAIVEIPGISKAFKGSLVAYNADIKTKLGVDVSKGTASRKVALEMASKGKEFFSVDVCVSFTGNAGPTSENDLPIGKVFIAINEEVFELNLQGDRQQIRQQAVSFVLNHKTISSIIKSI